jgi:hypothetical protein
MLEITHCRDADRLDQLLELLAGGGGGGGGRAKVIAAVERAVGAAKAREVVQVRGAG